eukprot:TRINITY_DN10151_c0_g1_i2.p1 TRINITY_DN10151_c0_g1~~TRINITY_DN10151_c0_g1_i2.p1  ORF type:complete len:265 (+),score=66.99 TRINITY_DN10151_c0_g1_i2:62-856(+)
MEPAAEPEAEEDVHIHSELLKLALAECPFSSEASCLETHAAKTNRLQDISQQRSHAQANPEPDAEFEEDEEHWQTKLLLALADCPFREKKDCQQLQHPKQASEEVPCASLRGLEEAALVAIRSGIALAKRGQSRKELVLALSRQTGLGGSVRLLRDRAEAGDASAKQTIKELDSLLRRGSGLKGVDAEAARARRLRLALDMPDTCSGIRQDGLQEAIALCAAGLKSVASAEPECEEVFESKSLLLQANAEVHLNAALEAGDVEF